MRALLDDAPVLHHRDHVGVAHRGQTVGDDQGRAPLHQVLEGPLDDRLGLGVERRGGLVEDQDRRVLVEGARDRQALALSAREPHSRLADHRVVAVRQLEDELLGESRPGAGAQLVLVHLVPARTRCWRARSC